jgi:carbon starvation protein
VEFTLDASNWAATFTPVSTKLGLSQANLFVQSYADMVNATWLSVIPTQYVKVLAGMWVAAFALTTLDTTNRLARYCISEMALPLKGKADALYGFLTNRWIASIIPAFIGIYLAYSKNFTIIWPSFGAANQLIASIALMTGACWVHSKLRSRFCNVAVIPAWILWVTVTAALIWFMIVVLPGNIASSPSQGWAVMGITIVMLIMNFIFIADFVRKYRQEVGPSE